MVHGLWASGIGAGPYAQSSGFRAVMVCIPETLSWLKLCGVVGLEGSKACVRFRVIRGIRRDSWKGPSNLIPLSNPFVYYGPSIPR